MPEDKYKKFFNNLLSKLVSFPSLSGQERECAEFLAEFLKEELGMDVLLRHVEGDSYNVYASLADSDNAANDSFASDNNNFHAIGNSDVPHAVKDSGSNKTLILGGHIDVVSPGEGWNTEPFTATEIDGKLFGRGTYDMKGGLAAQITALKILLDEGWRPDGRIIIVALSDEERFSIGANSFVDDAVSGNFPGGPIIDSKSAGLSGNTFFVMGEPHFDNIVIGATGKVLLELTVKGVSGHGADPDSGINAIDCMSRFLTLLNEKYYASYHEGKTGSHCILKIESKYEGYNLNIPDECKALLNKQLDYTEDADEFISDLMELYDSAVKMGVIRGELIVEKKIPFYPAYRIDEKDNRLSLLLNTLADRYSHLPELRLNKGVSDANVVYPITGIPTVLFGPGGAELHKANEYLDLNSAYLYIDMIKDFMIEYFK